MKKLISFILLTTVFFLSQAMAQDDKIKLPKEFKSGKIITEAECKKFLGEENYKFIVEVFNDKTAALQKCKNEMKQ